MIWQEPPYTIPLVMVPLVSLVLGMYLGFRHRNRGDIIGMVLILTNTEYMLSYALELAISSVYTAGISNRLTGVFKVD